MVKASFIVNLVALAALSGCSLNKNKMTNLEIIKSTYEGKTSAENGEKKPGPVPWALVCDCAFVITCN